MDQEDEERSSFQNTASFDDDTGREDDLTSYAPLFLPPAALIELEQCIRNGNGEVPMSQVCHGHGETQPGMLARVSLPALAGASIQSIPPEYRQAFALAHSSSNGAPHQSGEGASSAHEERAGIQIHVPEYMLSQISSIPAFASADASKDSGAGSTLNLKWFQREFWSYYMDLVEREEHTPTTATAAAAATTSTSATAPGSSLPSAEALEAEHQSQILGTSLPLARIKKVMKSDDEVEMISAEAPMLLARACEIFIADLTARAYISAEEARRKTITKQDIAKATTTSPMFDFLLDILPRKPLSKQAGEAYQPAAGARGTNDRGPATRQEGGEEDEESDFPDSESEDVPWQLPV